MNNEDYKKGYRDGWKDAMESLQPNMKPTPYLPGTPWPEVQSVKSCRTCGMDYNKMTHYVCYHPSCPTKVSCGGGGTNGGLK